MFFKITVLKYCAIFAEKQLRWSLFLIKLQTFIKKRLQHKCFPMNAAIFTGKHLGWSL